MKGTRALPHVETLTYLLKHGAPPDVEDIVGYTALHHACTNTRQNVELVQVLLRHGANPNHRNRYGEPPILHTFQTNQWETCELLLKAGGDIDLADADGCSGRSMYLQCGPQISAVVAKWMQKQEGQEAPMVRKECENCHRREDKGLKLMLCARCKSARYCSAECQRESTSSLVWGGGY